MEQKQQKQQTANAQESQWMDWSPEGIAEFRRKHPKMNKLGEWFFSDNPANREPLGDIIDYEAVFNL